MKPFAAALILFCFGFFALPAKAQKLNFFAGFYSINANPPSANASSIRISGPGAYGLSGQFSLRPNLEFGVGYTVFLSKGISGDMGFGPDLSLVYFPFSASSALVHSRVGIEFREIESLRPYGMVSFHQRQFQSAQSAYSGFGLGLGTEIQWSDRTAFRFGLRTMNLAGPSAARFEYSDLNLELQLQF